MNSNLEGIWEHMRELGLGALAHANRHAAYSSLENSRWPELSVLQAAHAAEILLKARIAQEHPLLIFETLPKPTKDCGLLDMKELFEKGKTVDWSDLPARLWATTGIKLENENLYREFGKLRNGIQHFSLPTNVDPAYETLKFIYGIIDPFINKCWGLYAVDYDEDYEPYIYFLSALISDNILFLPSPESVACFDDWDVDWSKANDEYKKELMSRIQSIRDTVGE